MTINLTQKVQDNYAKLSEILTEMNKSKQEADKQQKIAK